MTRTPCSQMNVIPCGGVATITGTAVGFDGDDACAVVAMRAKATTSHSNPKLVAVAVRYTIHPSTGQRSSGAASDAVLTKPQAAGNGATKTTRTSGRTIASLPSHVSRMRRRASRVRPGLRKMIAAATGRPTPMNASWAAKNAEYTPANEAAADAPIQVMLLPNEPVRDARRQAPQALSAQAEASFRVEKPPKHDQVDHTVQQPNTAVKPRSGQADRLECPRCRPQPA